MFTDGKEDSFGSISKDEDKGTLYTTGASDRLLKFISPYCLLLKDSEVRCITIGTEWIGAYHGIDKFNALAKELIKLKLPSRDKKFEGTTLYRGMVIKDFAKEKLMNGDPVKLTDRVATSWTTDKNIAKMHIKRHLCYTQATTFKDNAIIIKKTKVKPQDVVVSFSEESILGIMLGIRESEVVLLGNGGLDSITKKDVVSR